jgi:hypothetical protein
MARPTRTRDERRDAARRAERDPQAEREGRFTRDGRPPERRLSPEADRLLTKELRGAVGRDDAEVPAGAAQRARDRHAGRSPFAAALAANRPIIVLTFLMALVVGGIISLTTGWYAAVLLAVALHAAGTMVVAAVAVQLTTQVEHVAPETAARLEAEGVADPDRLLGELVEDYGGARNAGGVSEVVSSGNNERTVYPEDDPARSTLEQRTAMTPQSVPGPSGGEGSAIELLPMWLVAGVMVVSVVAVPFFDHGWIVPLLLVPIGLGWVALQRFMAHADAARSDRPVGDTAGATRRLGPIALFVVAAAVWLMLVLGLTTSYV